jgi:anaerobic selenocysteine-containing dehydrogenase
MSSAESHRPERIAAPWGSRTPYAGGAEWPIRVDQQLSVDESEVQKWVQSASLLHSNGDAMDIAVADGQIVGVRGRGSDRVNHGRLDPKDLYGWQANNSSDRLTRPLVRMDGELVEVDWDTAMSRMVDRSRELLDSAGPGSLGFYTTGQLFAEEYWTLTTIARAGIGTNHLDGNTRLCTATAGEALKESFGCDGQPASYSDVDLADTIALFGHNVAETQSVLWSRMLDRLDGDDPPQLIVVDPRRTPTAERAAVHLPVRPGTNLALMNALLHGLIAAGAVDRQYVQAHTVGYDELAQRVDGCTAHWAAEICRVSALDIERAIEILASAQRLLCTVLQGFYQSHQATAAAVQVNNLVLLRGMLGRPGCGVLQMNGQPTAQNTRECGANGDLPGFRNWENSEHIDQLAEIWNVDKLQIPHYGPPTHAMQIYRYAEQGSIKFLWISGTNPAVSLPELHRIRSILQREELFVVVQDLFLTETAQLADVVLPAATWGEKTGIFTNADRTVHLSEKAVEPPGEARCDLDIFLDYAARMDFKDKDGQPLVHWTDAESAFEAWKRASAGRPCDYSGLTYELLRGPSGIQWPCTAEAPTGTERLYVDGDFHAKPEDCESYGRDLITGASVEETEYRALNPAGKAIIKAAQYVPPHEDASDEYPYQLITGRTIYHFHTRTKTARAPELQAAAPTVWAELAPEDAARLGLADGDLVDIISPRGIIRAAARPGAVRPGTVFVPFHYGYWDTTGDRPAAGEPGTAANELTITDWDPVSKQPLFKTSAANVLAVAGDSR